MVDDNSCPVAKRRAGTGDKAPRLEARGSPAPSTPEFGQSPASRLAPERLWALQGVVEECSVFRARAHQVLVGVLLNCLGDSDGALAEARRALEADHRSVHPRGPLARLYSVEGDHSPFGRWWWPPSSGAANGGSVRVGAPCPQSAPLPTGLAPCATWPAAADRASRPRPLGRCRAGWSRPWPCPSGKEDAEWGRVGAPAAGAENPADDLLAKAIADLKECNPGGAKRHLSQALRQTGDGLLLAVARYAAAGGDTAAIVVTLREMADEDDAEARPGVLGLLVGLHLVGGQWQPLARALWELLEAGESPLLVWHKVDHLDEAMGLPEAARGFVEHVVLCSPALAAGWRRLACYYARRGRPADADAAWRRADAIDPRRPGVWLGRDEPAPAGNRLSFARASRWDDAFSWPEAGRRRRFLDQPHEPGWCPRRDINRTYTRPR